MKNKLEILSNVISVLKSELQQAENKINIFISISSIGIALISSVLIFVDPLHIVLSSFLYVYLAFMICSLIILLIAAYPRLSYDENEETIFFFKDWDKLNFAEYSEDKYEEDMIKTIKAYRSITRKKYKLIVFAASLLVLPIISILSKHIIKTNSE